MVEFGLSSTVEPSKTVVSTSLETGIRTAKGEERTGKTIWKRSDLGDQKKCAKKEEI